MTDRPGSETPSDLTSVDRVRRRLVEFTRALRMGGVDVPENGSLDAAQALATVGTLDRKRTRAALRATLVSDPADVPTFDRLFATFWRHLTAALDDRAAETVREPDRDPEVFDLPDADPAALDADDDSEPDVDVGEAGMMMSLAANADDARSTDDPTTVAGYSRSGRSTTIAHRAEPTIDEAVERAVERVVASLAGLEGRRYKSSTQGDHIDVRRALRESYGTGGVVVSTPQRSLKRTAVRCLFLVDVSRSVLDVVDRDFLVHVLRTFHAASRSMRTFFFDTSIREVTDSIGERSTADAFAALERAETEWGGGTRIGDALLAIRDEHPTAVDRRTVVFVVSDGLETGDVDALETGMAWLSRQSPLLLWCNPLASSPEYEPTCRGMAGALPFVDGLFAFTGVEDVEEMARQLKRFDGTQPLGYERTTERETS